MPRAQIKDEKTYTELRGHGESKEKAARIANAAAATSRSRVDARQPASGRQTWIAPPASRASTAGCGAVAGPRATDPSATRNALPSHGQVRQPSGLNSVRPVPRSSQRHRRFAQSGGGQRGISQRGWK